MCGITVKCGDITGQKCSWSKELEVMSTSNSENCLESSTTRMSFLSIKKAKTMLVDLVNITQAVAMMRVINIGGLTHSVDVSPQ